VSESAGTAAGREKPGPDASAGRHGQAHASNGLATAAALLVVAGAAASNAEEAAAPTVLPPAALRARAARGVHVDRSPRRRRPARLSRPTHATRFKSASSAPATPPAPLPADPQSELRNWIKDNSTLLSNASMLISIAALALGLLPRGGLLSPYIQGLMFGASLLLLAELHHQWPEDLQLHAFRHATTWQSHSWRMTGFAFLMQVATVLFAVWAIFTNPLILMPLTGIAVVLGFRRWYFRRSGNWVYRGLGIVSLIAVLLVTELLMMVAWAWVMDEHITIELFTDDQSHFNWYQ